VTRRRRRVEHAAVEVGVAGVNGPAALRIDRDGRVPTDQARLPLGGFVSGRRSLLHLPDLNAVAVPIDGGGESFLCVRREACRVPAETAITTLSVSQAGTGRFDDHSIVHNRVDKAASGSGLSMANADRINVVKVFTAHEGAGGAAGAAQTPASDGVEDR